MTDGRLSRYRVTARVEVQTVEILLAGDPVTAAESHEAAAERVCEETGADLREFELLEIDELGGKSP